MSTISGTPGNDSIQGTSGNDLIYGNQGGDTIRDGDGNASVYGGQGDDLVTVGNGKNLVFGNLGSDTVIAGDGGNVIYGGSNNSTVDPTDGADKITSGSGADLIYGNGGNDSISAGGGNDVVYGGMGADIAYGNAGADVVYGNRGDDALYGGQGNDTLYGGQGDDVLVGGLGTNVLVGGLGDDTAVFAGNRSDYTATKNSDGSFTVTGDGEKSTVYSTENFQFKNTSVTVADLLQGNSGSGGGSTPPVTATTDPATTLPANQSNGGHYYFGDGTTPDQNVALATQDQGQRVDVGFAAYPRQELNADAYIPTSSSQSGTILNVAYSAPGGTESTLNDSQANNANRDATSLALSFGVGTGSVADFLTGGGQFDLSIQGPAGTPAATFEAVSAPTQADPNHVNFVGTGTTQGSITDFSGTANHVDNSELFQFFNGGTHPAPGDVGTVNLDAFNSSHVEVAGVHATLNFGTSGTGNTHLPAI